MARPGVVIGSSTRPPGVHIYRAAERRCPWLVSTAEKERRILSCSRPVLLHYFQHYLATLVDYLLESKNQHRPNPYRFHYGPYTQPI